MSNRLSWLDGLLIYIVIILLENNTNTIGYKQTSASKPTRADEV